jgi:hypothetical protein
MEGAHFSTVYRGLPDFGGRRSDAVAASGGFVVLAFPKPALGQSGRRNPHRAVSAGGACPVLLWGTGIP